LAIVTSSPCEYRALSGSASSRERVEGGVGLINEAVKILEGTHGMHLRTVAPAVIKRYI
jgi:hypothetical protein